MESTAFRWWDVGRVAGVKLESGSGCKLLYLHVLACVYAFIGGDWERVHRRVGAGPKGVDPLPGMNNAPLLRPVAVCATVSANTEWWLGTRRFCVLSRCVRGVATRWSGFLPTRSGGWVCAAFAACRGVCWGFFQHGVMAGYAPFLRSVAVCDQRVGVVSANTEWWLGSARWWFVSGFGGFFQDGVVAGLEAVATNGEVKMLVGWLYPFPSFTSGCLVWYDGCLLVVW